MTCSSRVPCNVLGFGSPCGCHRYGVAFRPSRFPYLGSVNDLFFDTPGTSSTPGPQNPPSASPPKPPNTTANPPKPTAPSPSPLPHVPPAAQNSLGATKNVRVPPRHEYITQDITSSDDDGWSSGCCLHMRGGDGSWSNEVVAWSTLDPRAPGFVASRASGRKSYASHGTYGHELSSFFTPTSPTPRLPFALITGPSIPTYPLMSSAYVNLGGDSVNTIQPSYTPSPSLTCQSCAHTPGGPECLEILGAYEITANLRRAMKITIDLVDGLKTQIADLQEDAQRFEGQDAALQMTRRNNELLETQVKSMKLQVQVVEHRNTKLWDIGTCIEDSVKKSLGSSRHLQNAKLERIRGRDFSWFRDDGEDEGEGRT